MRDIVLDMTGFDLHLITKEELHKETIERYVSPMTITPAPSTVPEPEPEPSPEPKVEKIFQRQFLLYIIICHELHASLHV